MQVRVLFFGVLKDVLGRATETLSLRENSTVADLLSHYEQNLQGLNGKLSAIAIAVNQEYSRPDTKLNSGDEVALLPPVSGGSVEIGGLASNRIAIVRSTIDSKTLVDQLRQPQDGAVTIFEGVVRNHSRGRKTLFLEYEAYEAMALKQLEALRQESMAKFPIRDAAVIHRLGRLEIGETSVLIVVVSAHRSAAFEACRWLIDTLKRTVPIWKKEHFEDGAVWADGEAFPEPRSTKSELPASK
jgi:molybdopterin converting factor subunit 1